MRCACIYLCLSTCICSKNYQFMLRTLIPQVSFQPSSFPFFLATSLIIHILFSGLFKSSLNIKQFRMPNPYSCEKNIYQLKHNVCILILSLTFQNTVKILFSKDTQVIQFLPPSLCTTIEKLREESLSPHLTTPFPLPLSFYFFSHSPHKPHQFLVLSFFEQNK